jgi:sterol desaturase/sphingolipid hydroxylase (fatty acid hydroxylase superfamily)
VSSRALVALSNLDYDLTPGARFHLIEIALSRLIKFATITVLGPPVLAAVIFEMLVNATAIFNHGNIRLPAGVDLVMRSFVVTPDMHRVHHSVEDDETNSNFGFNLPWWERLFGTYRAQGMTPSASASTAITTRARSHSWTACC